MTRSATTRLLALGGAAVLGIGLLTGPTASTVQADAQPTADTIEWTSCYGSIGLSLDCALVDVPLDYDDPDGEQIELAMVRRPATDQANRIGSLFLNPGGPGGSGVEFVVAGGARLGDWLGEEASSRFDLIGIDPRVIGRSTPLQCFDTFEEAIATSKPGAFPESDAELPAFEAADRALAQACAEDGGPIGEHMATANVARDFDRVRELLGEEKMHYYGISYGSQLGTTYANMFPDRVGALVVDAVLDPIRWVNKPGRVPFSTQLRSAEGADETMDRFLELCDASGPERCALAPDAAGRWEALLDRLRDEPVTVVDPASGQEMVVDYDLMVSTAMGALYSSFNFASLADLLADLENQASPTELGKSARAAGMFGSEPTLSRTAAGEAAETPFPEFPEYVNAVEGFPGVGCVDTENPDAYSAVDRASDRSERTDGEFGPVWTWAGSTCTVWPFEDEDRYTGPWTKRTAAPVLVVGSREDPATRYEGAQKVRQLLPGSALVTTDTPGHGSIGANACAGEAVGAYLLDPSTAAELDGLECPLEGDPFAPGEGGGGGGLSPELNRAALDQTRPDLLPAARR